MSTQRKHYGAESRARVALEALKGHKTVNELAGTYGGSSHPDRQVEKAAPEGVAPDFLDSA